MMGWGTKNLPVCAIVRSTYHRLTELIVIKCRQAQAQIASGQALHYPCAHARADCAYARLEWQQYVDLVFRVESMFRIYEMEFQPMPDEEMWPPYEGQRVRPNPFLRRTMEGRPVSTRIRNSMDEVEPGPGKRCGLCR
ncbi:hypothetical protein AHAS_Ahas11G0167300 [Arachis hypogaea]